MSETDKITEVDEITTPAEEVAEVTDTVEPTEEVEVSKKDDTDYKAEYHKMKRLLEKKDKEKEAPKETQPGLDPKDMKALMDVDEEDWQELQDFAKFKQISISEAKNHSIMAQVLKDNAEFRKADKAKNTSRTKQNNSISGDQINADLKKGKVPKPGSAEAEELFWARRGGRKD